MLLSACFCTTSRATNYYFSNSSGNDSRSATQAQSASTPWKTVNKLNSIFRSLQPGDSVLFKRGETFYGTITVTKSGTSSQPIVISAYGKGNKPVIKSLVRLSNWVSVGNGIWESYNAALGTTVNVVLLNGVVQEMGRYPNSDRPNKGYLTIDAAKKNVSISDNELSASPNWSGAEVVIRKNRWTLDRNKVKLHDGSTIYYTASSKYQAQKGFGYFIQNHSKTLDKKGEWYYNPTSKKLRIFYGATAPTSNAIEASASDHVVYLSDHSHLVFDNLSFKGGNTDVIHVQGGNNSVIRNCEILFAGRNGVKIADYAKFKIENSNIQHSNSTGINIPAGSSFAVIRNNRVENTGLLPGMGEIDGTLGIGIQCYSEGAVIEHNRINNTGYNGIAVKLEAVKVRNNVIENFCITKDDGGGIYSANGSNRTFSDAEIIGNIILNGVGATQGTNSSVSNAEGIYMDDNSNGAAIMNNTVANCRRGIYLHNARSISVKKNTFFNNEIQFYAKHDNSGDPIRNLIIQNNTFFSKHPTQWVSQIESKLDDINSMGSFDYNYYARPLDDRVVISTTIQNSSGEKLTELFDLETWKQHYGKDANSKKSPTQIESYTLNKLIGSNKLENGGFPAKVDKVFGNDCTLTWKNDGLLDGGYLNIRPSSSGSSITMSVGALNPLKKYILKYSVIGEGDMSIGAYLRYGGKPYKPISPVVYRKVSTVRNNYELLLEPSVSQSSGTLVLSVDQQKTFCLDNIQLYEADAAVTNPDKFIRFEYNTSSKTKVVAIDGSYKDPNKRIYSNKVELPPYSSIILIKDIANELTKQSVESMKASVSSEEMDLNGVVQNNRIDLDWRSNSKPKEGFFEVEGSEDGENFKNIGKVSTNNAGGEDYIYKFSDVTPSAGWNFYRVKKGNHNTVQAYSNVINVYYKDSESFEVYPNPTNHLLHVSCDVSMKSKSAVVYIMSTSGQVIKTASIQVSDQFSASIDLSHLHEGTYIAKLVWENLVLYKKFVKEQ
jgi:parallel beta-helix repeat protein